MKKIFTSLFIPLSVCSFGQINKGQFLVGGSGNYKSVNYGNTLKSRNLNIDARGGTFIFNKFAVGVLTSYIRNKQMGDLNTSRPYKSVTSSINAGPFVRYYVMPARNKLNFLADASFFGSWTRQKNANLSYKYNSHGYAFAAGPAYFLSPSVSLEATAVYENISDGYNQSNFQIKAGFMIHLGK